MSGFWLVSYVALWAVVVVMSVLVVGLLRLVARGPAFRLSAQGRDDLPAVDRDGPEIASSMPTMAFESLNGFGEVSWGPTDAGRKTVVVFLSALCESCHDVVEPLNAIVRESNGRIRALAIIKGPIETTDAFLRVYPLQVPAIADPNTEITMGRFGVRRNPFALYYDEEGSLVRKGTVEYGRDGLLALLGDASAPPEALMRVSPPPSGNDELVFARL